MQKLLELVETTLNIAYRVDGHGQDPAKIIEMDLPAQDAPRGRVRPSVEYVRNRQPEKRDFRIE